MCMAAWATDFIDLGHGATITDGAIITDGEVIIITGTIPTDGAIMTHGTTPIIDGLITIRTIIRTLIITDGDGDTLGLTDIITTTTIDHTLIIEHVEVM